MNTHRCPWCGERVVELFRSCPYCGHQVHDGAGQPVARGHCACDRCWERCRAEIAAALLDAAGWRG